MNGDRALLLARLRPTQPDGTVIGETQRACHLVPVPDSPTMPNFLLAYCGVRIGPGTCEVLPSVVGMPCELCMARAPIPITSALRLPTALGRPPVTEAEGTATSRNSHQAHEGGKPV